ncbi:MAG: chorismate mutase, partial [Desulfofustis sp.]|nr:chorismate mutase [Desulfofustis sp.]
MTDNSSEINRIRTRIDAIDNNFLDLLKERIDCAKAIGRLKDEDKRAKWDPLREREIYTRLLKANNGVFPEPALRSILHEIITSCRLSQKKILVAYLGPEATFTHLA